jgi:hypothetical protein
MMTDISRRTVLAGAAAAAALATVSVSLPSAAAAVRDPEQTFLELSAALTGIDKEKLAPNVDPVGVNSLYFKRARDARPAAFDRMLQIVEDNKADLTTVGNIILNQSGTEVRFLARSIMLAWYLGAWYDPTLLEQNSYKAQGSPVYYYTARRYSSEVLIPFEVISPATYTQGWVWRVAQAHPMGYSNLQFGYWSKEPPALEEFIKST